MPAVWYAVQCSTRQEQATCDLIQRVAGNLGIQHMLEECFVPMRVVMVKQEDKLLPMQEALLPGYLIAVTKPKLIAQVNDALYKVPKYTKVLGPNSLNRQLQCTPLAPWEVEWICGFTTKGHRVVDLSEGFVEGGKVVVTKGPLVGREALIKKVNRRKRIAYLELTMLGRTTEVKVGLNLVKPSKE